MRLAGVPGKGELVIKVNTLMAIKGVDNVRVSVEVGRSTIPPKLRISTPTGIETEFFNQNPLQETIEIKAKAQEELGALQNEFTLRTTGILVGH